MSTTTTNYGFILPGVNDPVDEDLWGGYLNGDLTSLDTLVKVGICTAIVAQSSGFTATSTISTRNLYLVDATGGVVTATLPTAASAGLGGTVLFKKSDASANAVTITRASTDTIDGATTYPLNLRYQGVALISDGVSAWSVGYINPVAFGGDSGSGGFKGLVPAPSSGDAAAGKFLKADGVWTVPAYPSIVLAQGYVTNLGTSPSVAGGSNITSISRTSQGVYAVAFTVVAADTNFIPTGTVTMSAHPDMFICEITSVTTAGFTFKTKTTSNDLFDPDNVRLIVFKGA